MSNKMKRIIALLLVVVLAGCSQSLDIQLENEVNLFLSNDGNTRIRLTKEDKQYVELNEWLRANNSEWYVTSGHYRGGVYVQSGNYGIQITKTHVVIYSKIGSEQKATYIQDLNRGELSAFRDIGK